MAYATENHDYQASSISRQHNSSTKVRPDSIGARKGGVQDGASGVLIDILIFDIFGSLNCPFLL